MLTDRQRQILDFLTKYVDAHGYPPTVREIGEAVGLASPSTVHAHLANLERAGLLKRDPTKPRAIELRREPKATSAQTSTSCRWSARSPPAGPCSRSENVEEYLAVPEPLSQGGEEFLLRVKGDSMIDAGILDGDIVGRRARGRTRGTATSWSRSRVTTSRPTRRRSSGSSARTGACGSSPRTRRSSRSTRSTSQILGKVIGVFRQL